MEKELSCRSTLPYSESVVVYVLRYQYSTLFPLYYSISHGMENSHKHVGKSRDLCRKSISVHDIGFGGLLDLQRLLFDSPFLV